MENKNNIIIIEKNKEKIDTEYEIFDVIRLTRKDNDLKVDLKAFVNEDNNTLIRRTKISLSDVRVAPDDWIKIPGFLHAYQIAKAVYTDSIFSGFESSKQMRDQIEKFYSLLSDENKLILEVNINGEIV